MSYLILKLHDTYNLINTFTSDFFDFEERFIIYKNNRVYKYFPYYNEKVYFGKLVFETDNIEEASLEFVRLLNENSKKF